ncbi:MAG: glycosyltransferase family 2 protein [Gemmatimonadaceae bacterium]|nr:glycosyltransferase family 2 protein [Gemmatimonadaceae bacterium]
MTTATAPFTRFTPPLTATTPELSVVMPCLNEADTIATCIEKAQRAIGANGISAEIVIADNGSTDGSQEIARKLGARVIAVDQRGYGAALMGGINAARGTYVMMGDADDSYDWAEIPRFLAKLREGFELVQGCRLETGGGTVKPGAMPFLHRWWGNPMFTALARWWFRTPIHDIHCGMRAFRRDMWLTLDQRCTGMEFASEMVIKASLFQAKTAEIPITLSPDGRTAHPPHLKTFRDGWRHLRFFLLFSPRWLFLMPGLALILAGTVGYALAMPRLSIGKMTFDVHTLLFASLAIICGYQSIAFALMTKVFAIMEGLLPEDPRLNRFFALVNLESGLSVGALAMVVGLGLLGAAVHQWSSVDFGALNYEHTMRWVIPGVMLTALGFQTILSSFFASLMGMRRR